MAQLDVRDINTLKAIPNTVLCLRICNAQQQLDQDIRFFDSKNGTRPIDYVIPEIHNIYEFIEPFQDSEKVSELSAIKSIKDDSL